MLIHKFLKQPMQAGKVCLALKYLDCSESELCTFLLKNWDGIFNLEFVASEIRCGSGRLDILAFYPEGNLNIIIELKAGRAKPTSFGQIIGYLNQIPYLPKAKGASSVALLFCRSATKNCLSLLNLHDAVDIIYFTTVTNAIKPVKPSQPMETEFTLGKSESDNSNHLREFYREMYELHAIKSKQIDNLIAFHVERGTKNFKYFLDTYLSLKESQAFPPSVILPRLYESVYRNANGKPRAGKRRRVANIAGSLRKILCFRTHSLETSSKEKHQIEKTRK